MASGCTIIQRGIATSSACLGKRNFRKFLLYNKRGSAAFKERQAKNPHPDIPIDRRGTREPGMRFQGKFKIIPEMVPEIIVPDLKGFNLKPYVTYRSTEVVQGRFTAENLFDSVYAKKIVDDFKANKLGPNGEPLEPSEFEKMTPQEAKDLAGKTGTDIF